MSVTQKECADESARAGRVDVQGGCHGEVVSQTSGRSLLERHERETQSTVS